MPVNVEELESEVSVEGGAPSTAAPAATPERSDDDANLKRWLERTIRDRLRTAARGFDD